MTAGRDEEILTFALAHGRTILTQDADFLRLHAAGEGHAGVVYCAQQRPVSHFLRGVLLVYEVLSPADMVNHVEFV